MSSDPYTGTLTVGTGSVTGQTTISTIQSDSNSTSSPSTVTITSPLLQVLQLSGANPSSNVMEVTENATIQGSLTVKTNATTKTLTTTGTASFTNMNISGQFLVQGVDVLALRNQIMQLV